MRLSFTKFLVPGFLLCFSILVNPTAKAQEELPYYSLLYEKSMIPQPDSVRVFSSYLVPYDGMTMNLFSYQNFALGASYANWFPKHTFGLEFSIPYTGKRYSDYESRTELFQQDLKYVSKGYVKKRYPTFKAQAYWKYILMYKEEPYVFYAYKNAPTPNDSVPVIEGVKQKRYYLRGGMQYLVSPNLYRLEFTTSKDSPFTEEESGFLLHKNRALTIFAGFEMQKELFSYTSIDRVKFRAYRKVRTFYGDISFQPFAGLGKLEVVDSLSLATNIEGVIALTNPMSKEDKTFIRDSSVTVNRFAIRIGYTYEHLFNSPFGFGFESGILTGVSTQGTRLGSYYTKVRLLMDIRLTKPLRDIPF
ncbi:MAG: hypothetical protein N4A41_14265 [Crocinitomicaceae bacterium]|jgi:hypothetical protein|nr:hypothetical protein [Crocinitomicaceae bacterium]